jgi:Protein of unknown function (DUF1491)
MIEPRLAAHMLVSSLIRRANAQGDFATVLRRGDETAGNILIVALEKGASPRLLNGFRHSTDPQYGAKFHLKQLINIVIYRNIVLAAAVLIPICGFWNWTSRFSNGWTDFWNLMLDFAALHNE